mmetsp:Transcript_55022/g.126568  ORF Transcript_55022/g.126568 Transcript_55022/m.126568 type:complete len:143 (-) Transcript_55022:34-462(-)
MAASCYTSLQHALRQVLMGIASTPHWFGCVHCPIWMWNWRGLLYCWYSKWRSDSPVEMEASHVQLVKLEARGQPSNLELSNSSVLEEEARTCAICLDEPSSHVLIPCGHFCLCAQCAHVVLSGSRQCPMCRLVCEQAVKVYM